MTKTIKKRDLCDIMLYSNKSFAFLIKTKKEFKIWKKQTKEKITKLKYRELIEDEVYEWLQAN